MRTIKAVHPCVRDDIDDLITRRALPTRSIDHLDPFLFLNHHGPQTYPPDNEGLPFGPHPHRGFETVTFILKGSLAHKDSGGHESVIDSGGVQWMTAGRGLVHSEISPEDFLEQGGELEILQLWVNLPSKLKLTEPAYIGLQKNEIPTLNLDDGRVSISLIAGSFGNGLGPIEPLTDIELMTINLQPEGHLEIKVPRDRNIFFYVVDGKLNVNGRPVDKFHLVEFSHDDEKIEITAESEAILLFGHALPYNEPIVAHGPFVMNTKDEILDAIRDYQAGNFE